jgi:4-hydroxy-tetrahydrodipicolinate reductase
MEGNMESFNYGLIGSNGRLGAETKKAFTEAGHKLLLEYYKDYENIISAPDLIVDCSLPEVFAKSVELVKRYNVPFVIATTGLTEKQFDELKELSQSVPVVQSYNYSVGIQILLKLAAETEKIVPDWDIEITETHHRFKKDKPSGTALMIKDVLSKKDVNISSLRLGNVAGTHTVSFGGLGEVLTITHDATSRRTFAEGILKSAEFIITKTPGLYSFKDVVFSKKG